MKGHLRQLFLAVFFAALWNGSAARAIIFTSDTSIGIGDTNYDYAEIVVTNCTLTVDGPHTFSNLLISADGVLTHTGAANGFVVPPPILVSNELHVLTGTNSEMLASAYIDPASIVVFNDVGTVMYSNGVDYLVSPGTNFSVSIQRTDASAIADGATVSVSYTVTNPSVPSGLNLVVNGDVTIDSGGAIDASGRGYGGRFAGPGHGFSVGNPASGGGGSFGGYGGSSSSNAAGGLAFGSTAFPADPGGAGGSGVGGYGGNGGGAVKLVVIGALLVNGDIVADGWNATNSRSGGGAGGSVWLTAATISGSGTISANGGAGEPIHGGGGGGGRIALYSDVYEFGGNILARGGVGFVVGGAGTIYFNTGASAGMVLADNGGQAGARTLISAPYAADLVVTGAASVVSADAQTISNLVIAAVSKLVPPTNQVTVLGNAIVQPGGMIVADGLGSPPRTGAGAGGTYVGLGVTYGGGGGYGGYGANASNTPAIPNLGGTSYGSATAPVSSGSGGGGTWSSVDIGGNGGGAIHLVVNGALDIEGTISANGSPGSAPGGGGGSGGSVWVTAGTLFGSGLISANGGDGYRPTGAGGGGGRIAVIVQTNGPAVQITAYGGDGSNRGGAGTIYRLDNAADPVFRNEVFIVDNGGVAGTSTPVSALTSSMSAVIVNNGIGQVVGSTSLSVGNLLVGSNSFLVLPGLGTVPTLNVASFVTVDSGGGIIADGLGPVGYTGSGGTSGSTGGGHGGYGGTGTNGLATAGTPYDQSTGPALSGSSGAPAVSSGANIGGTGGGVVRLTAGGGLHLDGRISANGRPGALGISGGGSGGSIWLTLGTFSGSGTITANGGSGRNGGGGGAGGRIAITYSGTTNNFIGTISAYGGAGYHAGAAGTIYTKASASSSAMLLADNGGVSGNFTPVGAGSLDDITARAGANVSLATGTMRNLVIASNASLSLGSRFIVGGSPPTTISAMVNGYARIEEGGAVVMDGVGSGPASGPGYGAGVGWGGGHGGYGGGGSNSVTGGPAYDTITSPTSSGSGGYPNLGQSYSGGSGGGAIHLTVNGALTVDGIMSANGTSGFSTMGTVSAGGGSGGSIWLTAGSFSGSGSISANGGSGANGGGGGGGGRIAIVYGPTPASNLFSGTITAFGGTGYHAGGAGTVYTRVTPQNAGLVLVDNGDLSGVGTPLSASFVDDLKVTRGGRAAWSAPITIHNLLVTSNGWMYPLVLQGNVTFTASSAIIEAGGGIVGDGLGYGVNQGAGCGKGNGGGGGYGGLGGANPPSGGGGAYGSILTPSIAGSGGDGYSAQGGGAGGGLIQLAVMQGLTVNGIISANGANGVDQSSGGGAGGSVWLTAGSFSGTGAISANGGSGLGTSSGGGGGGRVALYYSTNNFAGTIAARGGGGSFPGGAGTIYLNANGQAAGRLLVDNGGVAGTNTPLSGTFQLPTSPFDLTIGGGASVYPATALPVLSNLTVTAGGALVALPNQPALWVATIKDVNVDSGGTISARGSGFLAGGGPGHGLSVDVQGSGGGHGGVGGASASGALGGTNYGSATQPVTAGSGGGSGSGIYSGGSQGGGALRLSVAGRLTVGGVLDASGNPGVQDDSGGGAGGSIWVNAGTMSGGGLISANGGAGELYGGGGGGGGRIAIYSPANTFTGLVNAVGGAGASAGTDGTVLISTNPPGLQVTLQSPQGVVSNTVSFVDLTFNEVLDPNSETVSNFTLITPVGPIAESILTASAVGLSTVRLSFPQQNLLGDYQVKAGPVIFDLFGQSMSQVYIGSFTVVLPTISGTVTDTNGAPVAGVSLQPNGGLIGVTTDVNGQYVLGVPPGWTGTVTPSAAFWMFAPGSRNYANVTNSVPGEDYLAVGTIAANISETLEGTNLLMSWHGLPGVTYQVYSSTNLIDWQPYGTAITGSNAVIGLPIPTDVDPKRFFRVGAGN